jgi:ribosomal protein L31E
MEITEYRVNVHDLLARKLEYEAKDAVSGRMVRAEVEEHLAVAQGVKLALALRPGRVWRDGLEEPPNLAVEHDAWIVLGAMLFGRARLLGRLL